MTIDVEGLRSDMRFLRSTVEAEIERNGTLESTLVRAGLLRDILDFALSEREADKARIGELEEGLRPFAHLAREAEGYPDEYAFTIVFWDGDEAAAASELSLAESDMPDPIILAKHLRTARTLLENPNVKG